MSKIALITGASRGLGKDMALRLAQNGNDVIITYQSKLEEANNVVSQIRETGQKAAALKLDVGEIKSFDDFVSKLQTVLPQEFGTMKLDVIGEISFILVCCNSSNSSMSLRSCFIEFHYIDNWRLSQPECVISNL